jgi:hypothetical protein
VIFDDVFISRAYFHGWWYRMPPCLWSVSRVTTGAVRGKSGVVMC